MELQSLHNINIILARLIEPPEKPGDLKGVLRHIGKIALEAFAPDACVIRSYNPMTGKLLVEPIFMGDVSAEERVLYNDPRPHAIAHQALVYKLFCVEDLPKQPTDLSCLTYEGASRSLAVLAMFTLHRQKLLGVIYLDYHKPHAFTGNERERLRLFAMQASFLLQEAWSSHHYEQTARLGQEVNQRLSTIEELFETLQTYVDSVLDYDHTLFLAVYRPQVNLLDIHIREQERSFFLQKPIQGACKYVIDRQEPLLIPHASGEMDHLPCQIVSLDGTLLRESYVFVPLVLRGDSLGVLSIQHGQPDVYGQEDLLIFKLLANYVALALHNLRLYNSLNQLNETGQLLTRQIEAANTLQMTTETIRGATQADVVVIYYYDSTRQHFMLPPCFAGELLDPTPYSIHPTRPVDMAVFMLDHPTPIFARNSKRLYHELNEKEPVKTGNFQERERVRSTVTILLKVGEEKVGVLFINYRQRQRFDATQKIFLEGLALYAAIAIKNAQVFGSLSQRRIRELEILQEIDRALDCNLELNEVLRTLITLAAGHVGAEEASILLYNPHLQALQVKAAIGLNAEKRFQHTFTLQDTQGIIRWVLENKKPVRVNDVLRDEYWHQIYMQAAVETRSELDVPLVEEEEVLGVLNLESRRENAFSYEDERFLVTLAGQALLAIKNTQAYEREKRLSEERRVLNEISKEITSRLNYAQVFDLIVDKALFLTGTTLGTLHCYDPIRQDLWLVAGRGIGAESRSSRKTLDQGIIGYVAKTKQGYNVDDVTLAPWDSRYEELFPGTRSELAVPMLAGDQLRGVLNLESPHPHNFAERDVHLLLGLADLAVVALQNAERYENALQDALRFDLLYQAGQQLSRITDLEQLQEAYAIILRIALRKCQSLIVIRRFDAENRELELVDTSHPENVLLHHRIKPFQAIHGPFVAPDPATIVLHDLHQADADFATLEPLDPSMRSLLITPILFKEQYYGRLEVHNPQSEHFQEGDSHFFEGLAQQLASTIHRLEAVWARLEAEQRALASEAMSEIGQTAFELTHRWDNDLGLVRSYANDIQAEMKHLGITSSFITRKLENMVQATRTVLDLSKDLKQEVARSGETVTNGKLHTVGEKPLYSHPEDLFQLALARVLLPETIQISVEIEEDVLPVHVFQNQILDILHNLISNAIDAIAGDGRITLQAHNTGNFVALEVTDTGNGVPEQSQRRIFDLFYSTKGSSGFGLWSARRNALKNHGKLTISSSKVGRGTTFTLLLPVEKGTQDGFTG